VPPRRPLPPELTLGAFTVGQGRAAGLGDRRMRGADLDRPFRGVRVVMPGPLPPPPPGGPAAPAALLERCAALAVALGDEPVFSHLTAARLWPVPLPPDLFDDDLHIGVPPPARPPRRRGVAGHKLLDPRAVAVRRHGRRLVDPATLFCQLAAVLTVPDLVAVGDALIHVPVHPHPLDDRPWLTEAELAERVAMFRGRGKAAAGRAVRRVRPGVESRPETLVRLAMVDAGLPEPEVNVPLVGPRGRFLGRADLVYRTWRVIVEYDGDQHRTDTRQFDRDVRRLEGFAAHGWTVVRITGRAFFGDRATCIDRVRFALIAAGWRG
jgi:hypothetical protein